MSKIIVFSGYPRSLLNFRGKLLESMVDLGHEVYAVSSKDNKVRKELEDLGVCYKEIEFDRTGFNPFKDFWTLLKIFLLMATIKPDFILSYTLKPVVYVGLVSNFFKAKVFSLITGLGFIFYSRGFFNKCLRILVIFLYKIALIRSNKVFFQNSQNLDLFYQQNILKDRNKSLLVNGSGVDLQHFEFSQPPSGHNFLMVSRLLEDKGIYEFLQAAKEIKEQFKHVNFTLAGPFDSNPASLSRADLQVFIDTGIVDYLGELEDVRPAFKECSCFVLPSYHEGLPRTNIEAMASGRAVITTDVPGCRDTVLDNINGLLVPSKEYRSLALAMKKIIDDPDLIIQMGNKSRAIVEEKFDVRVINRILLFEMGLDN